MEVGSMANFVSPNALILMVLISCIPISYLLFSTRISSKKKQYYHPDFYPYPIVGHLPQFLRHRRNFLDWSTNILAASPSHTIVFHRPGNINSVITANPVNVEHMLKSNFDNFPKGSRFRSLLHDFLGHGIFNCNGSLWRLQRKTVSFEFSTRSLRSFIHRAVADEISVRLLPLLRRTATNGHSLDLQETLEHFAFDNICKVAFDVDPACLDPEPSAAGTLGGLSTGFASAFRIATELSAGRFRYIIPGFWKVKKMLDVGSERKLRKSIATVHDFALQIIRSRKKEHNLSSSANDLLARFIAQEGNSSDEFLRDVVVSFLLAGRETTSSALTWFFWLLSARPNVEHNILTEIAAVRARFGSAVGTALSLEELREMHYLCAALTEAMRLYPPVPFNSVECEADDVLPDGTEIKKGSFMSYNAYAMGRMEGIWGNDCRDFRPERWLDGGVAGGEFRQESPFKFPAFHAGPRMCLGKEMAYIQMKSIVACVLEGFVVEVLRDKHTCPDLVPSLTLRMGGGLPVRIKDRFAPTSV